MRYRGSCRAIRRPALWHLLVISAAVATVAVGGCVAVLSLAGNAQSSADPDQPAAPYEGPAPSYSGVGPPIISISDQDGAVALVWTRNPIANGEALVSGRVERLSGGCVGTTRAGTNDVVIVWPAGTTFAEDSSGLRVPRYGVLTYGSQLTTAGAYVTIAESGLRGELPPDCDATDVAYISARPY